MKQFSYKTINIDASIGTNSFNDDVKIDADVIGAVLVYRGSTPTNIVNLSIYDGSNHRVNAPTDISFWQQRQGGTFTESLTPLSIKGNQNITAEITSRTAFKTDFKAQLILVSEKNEYC